MQLNQKLVERLRDIATKAVAELRVSDGKYLEIESLESFAPADAALPKNIRDDLASWIDDDPFSTFVYGFLQDQLEERPYDSDQGSVPLTAIASFEDPAFVAEGIVNAFASLPWTYAFIFPLPITSPRFPAVPEATLSVKVTENISLVRPGPDFTFTFPLGKAYTLANLQEQFTPSWYSHPTSWDNGLYLRIDAKGYLPVWVETELINSIQLQLRAFGGLLAGSGVAKPTRSGISSASEGEIYVYLQSEGGWTLRRSRKVASEHMSVFRSMVWLDLPNAQPQDGDWTKWDRVIAKRLAPAFADRDEAALLRRSGQWFFDSHAGSNRLLHFVQATVALEILLGDKATSDVIGLGELLANRAAYTLARSHSERSDMIAQFRKIYSTRSQIVHRGKQTLSDDEYQQLHLLRWFCSRLISNELDLMGDNKAGEAK